MQIKLTLCTNDLLEDICEHLGSSIVDECIHHKSHKPIDEEDDIDLDVFDIVLFDNDLILVYKEDSLVIIREDNNSSLAIAGFRFHEVIII